MPHQEEDERIKMQFIEGVSKLEDKISELNAKMQILRDDEDFIDALSNSIPEKPEDVSEHADDVEARTFEPSQWPLPPKERQRQVADINAKTFEPSGPSVEKPLPEISDDEVRAWLEQQKQNPKTRAALQKFINIFLNGTSIKTGAKHDAK